MPHWSPRFVVSFLFSPEVAVPVILAALGIAFTVALAPTMRNIRLAHWFFAIAGIWAYGGIQRWLSGGDNQMKYFISFLSCGLVGTLWLASYVWVEGNRREQAQQQDKPAESKPDKKDAEKQKTPAEKKNGAHKTPSKPPQETHGDNSPNVGSITQGPGSITQIGGQGNQATVNNFGPQLPKLLKVSETGKANPDGSFTTECVLRVESDVAPGHLTFQVNAQGLQDVIFTPNTSVSASNLANVLEGNNFYKATVNGPSGEYLLSVKTKEKTHITIGATFN